MPVLPLVAARRFEAQVHVDVGLPRRLLALGIRVGVLYVEVDADRLWPTRVDEAPVVIAAYRVLVGAPGVGEDVL
eukprot:422469-Pyramimonas_sp.AAC.1